MKKLNAYVINTSDAQVNIRRQPTTKSPVIGTLKVGDMIEVDPLDMNEQWHRVLAPQNGWVHKEVMEYAVIDPDKKLWVTVPYRSQTGQGASLKQNDCGPACALSAAIKMRPDSEGLKTMSVDAVARMYDGDKPRSLGSIVDICHRLGVSTARTARDINLHQLEKEMRADRPVIMLCNYRYILPSHRFKGGHYIIPVGMSQNHIWINDPYDAGPGFKMPIKAYILAVTQLHGAGSFPYQGIMF